MGMYDAEYLRQARAICDEFEVHLIADEIAVASGARERCSPISRPG